MTRWRARGTTSYICSEGRKASHEGHEGSARRGLAGVSSSSGAVMGKKSSDIFEITCPCCSAVLKVDAAVEAVIAHTPPPTKRMFNDMEEAAKAMHQQDDRRESLFRQSVEAEKNKAQLLEKKFAEAVKRAKETPDEKFIRDIDLD